MKMDSSAFMENLKQLFAEGDVDNNGCLGREEFSKLCAKIGLTKEAAHETFDRLDIDKDDRVTFDEFAAGFNQCKSAAAAPSTTTTATTTTKRPPAPSTLAARKSASPVGVMSLGGQSSSSSANNLLGLSRTIGSSGGASSSLSADISDFGGNAPGSSSFDTAGSGQNNRDDSMIVYSSETGAAQDYYDQPAGSSGQFGSLFGGGGGGGNSLNGFGGGGGGGGGSGSGSFSQMRNMQELLDCVQKLQSENQILTQIFFKDKREREEYISQLGEEFDQQVREVEERANRRAREELENEKKRLREMMQTERETLQHHYKTIEKMSKIIQAPGGQGSRSSSDLLLDGEGMDKVKSKLEDTYLENRQLKRSLLDTKTDVAMIWKEMEKLKQQYEVKLSSAYEKNNETRSECDHIKQQLTLMKDSNRKLQDASDVITTYITDKVDPVIKGATAAADEHYLSPNGGANSLTAAGGGTTSSQSNSRRGSVLSEYLNSHPDSMDEDGDGDGEDDSLGLRSAANLQGSPKHQQPKRPRARFVTGKHEDLDGYEARSSTASSMGSSGGGGGGGTLPRINLPQSSSGPDGGGHQMIKKSSSMSPMLTTATAATPTADNGPKRTSDTERPVGPKDDAAEPQPDVSRTSGRLKSLGRHLFLGSKDRLSQSTSSTTSRQDSTDSLAKQTKSLSLDQGGAASGEPLVEPADGPSVATFNIILVGDSFVGKSSFAARFMEGSFVQGLISNCSIDFKTKTYKVDGTNYTVNLWDTA